MTTDYLTILDSIIPLFKDIKTDTFKYNGRTEMPQPRQVIFNKNATIVYFEDNTKVIVRKSQQDEYNKEHAIVYAIVKRAYGIINDDGTVEGNGMGNMLSRLIKNAINQEEQSASRKNKAKFSKVDVNICDKCEWRDECKDAETSNNKDEENKKEKSYTTSKADIQPRDSKGRFVKKANR